MEPDMGPKIGPKIGKKKFTRASWDKNGVKIGKVRLGHREIVQGRFHTVVELRA
jgi:hypothetical protein